MPHKVRIALDAMGGDHGPSVVVPGAAIALQRHPDCEFILFGDRTQIEPLLSQQPGLAGSRLVHTDVAVRMDDKPSQALRNGRWKSSMWLAIDAVKRGEADVAVSAGNTGALMAMAKFHLKTMPGIDRPAIAAIWPTIRGRSIVLDLGATIGTDPRAPGPARGDGQRHGARLVRGRPAQGRPAQHRRRGGQGPRADPRSGQDPARGAIVASRIFRLRRRRRHRQGHRRCGRDRGLHRQHRAQDRRRNGTAVRRLSQGRDERIRCSPRSAIFLRQGRVQDACAKRWIRGRPTAVSSSA